jgi:hypothetical protein
MMLALVAPILPLLPYEVTEMVCEPFATLVVLQLKE